MIRNTTVVDSEGAAETNMDTGEHNADPEIKSSNAIEISDRPVRTELIILLTQ